MTTTTIIFVGMYCLLIGYGLGLRVSSYRWSRDLKRAAAEFDARAAKLDQQITEAQEH